MNQTENKLVVIKGEVTELNSEKEFYAYKAELKKQRAIIKGLIGSKIKLQAEVTSQSRINNIQKQIEYLETLMEAESIFEDWSRWLE